MAKRVQAGEVIHPSGIRTAVHPHDGKKFSLKELQGFVGGSIELVTMKRGNGHATMYVNEEGKLEGLARNYEATELALVSDYGDWIVGRAIIVRTVTE
jgi:hypothetical protein